MKSVQEIQEIQEMHAIRLAEARGTLTALQDIAKIPVSSSLQYLIKVRRLRDTVTPDIGSDEENEAYDVAYHIALSSFLRSLDKTD